MASLQSELNVTQILSAKNSNAAMPLHSATSSATLSSPATPKRDDVLKSEQYLQGSREEQLGTPTVLDEEKEHFAKAIASPPHLGEASIDSNSGVDARVRCENTSNRSAQEATTSPGDPSELSLKSLRLNLNESKADMPAQMLPKSDSNVAAFGASGEVISQLAEGLSTLSCGTSTEQHSNIIEDQMWVPLDRVGALIGVRGASIRSIQERSGTFVLIRNDCVNRRSNEKLLTITGPESGVALARRLILEQMQSESSRAAPERQTATRGSPRPLTSSAFSKHLGAYSQFATRGMAEQHQTRTVYIPNLCVGICIGKSGETIRDLQERSGAHIKIAPSSSSKDREAERSVDISGTPQSIELAHTLLNDIVNEALQGFRRTQELSAQSPPHVGVTNSSDGARGGRDVTNTDVAGDRRNAAGAGDRSLMFGGVADAEYYEHYGAAPPPRRVDGGLGERATYPTSSLAVTVLVPNDKVGIVIGRGGATIRELQRQSGARIVVAREVDANRRENTRPITITGPAAFIEVAKTLIDDKIAENVSGHSEPVSVSKARLETQQTQHTPQFGFYAGQAFNELLYYQQQQHARAMMLPYYGSPYQYAQSIPQPLLQQPQAGAYGYATLPFPILFDPMHQPAQAFQGSADISDSFATLQAPRSDTGGAPETLEPK
mmetsp:Transcript_11205/g.30153  ORF Transcript_11205/g.30153 Transcript_11205/m.30153 type:complete len:664 (-) Transcript_11205:82-2073(-)|eukprot:CAMPEP_0185830210 /NCGR_PEP_ID=MMETSP1353-20130828/686_1 /TAXON_ID=1077150 /ORGANISM="Erythrolobus australicus, Strain CCMP3124" /LENGTH=663 /DNA_ID=CAMNT_0028528075 /DNA_START=469 /DNA_END=2460 /DNA_ORIENTATION=-